MYSDNTQVIILAAGQGSRYGAQKQFTTFKDVPMYEWVYNTALECFDAEDIVVVGVDVEGGDTRRASVYEGLKTITKHNVIILEAARPLVTAHQIRYICDEVQTSNSVSFYMPCVNTVYFERYKHLDRNECVYLQTPQAFTTEVLLEAHEKVKEFPDATDDTLLVYKQFYEHPTLILGDYNLRKITHPIDIEILKTIDAYNE